MAPKSAAGRKAGKQVSTSKQSIGKKRLKTNSSTAANNSSARPRQSKKNVGEKSQRKSEEPLPFKNFRLRPSVYSKWVPMSKSSEMFVIKMLESNVMHVLSKTSVVNKDTARTTLNDLQTTLVSAVRGLKVPKPAITSHQTLQTKRVSLERKLDQNTEQILRLDEALEEEEEVLSVLEQEKTQLERSSPQHAHTPTPNKHKVHPALKESMLEADSEDYGQLTALIAAACHHQSSTLS